MTSSWLLVFFFFFFFFLSSPLGFKGKLSLLEVVLIFPGELSK